MGNMAEALAGAGLVTPQQLEQSRREEAQEEIERGVEQRKKHANKFDKHGFPILDEKSDQVFRKKVR